MQSISRLLAKILESKGSYPVCVVRRAERFQQTREESARAVIQIRSEFYDIWSAYKSRPTGHRASQTFSMELKSKFGSDRMQQFHALASKVRLRALFIQQDLAQLRGEVTLAEIDPSELSGILDFVQRVNAGTQLPEGTDWVWFNRISAPVVAEILLWGLMK